MSFLKCSLSLWAFKKNLFVSLWSFSLSLWPFSCLCSFFLFVYGHFVSLYSQFWSFAAVLPLCCNFVFLFWRNSTLHTDTLVPGLWVSSPVGWYSDPTAMLKIQLPVTICCRQWHHQGPVRSQERPLPHLRPRPRIHDTKSSKHTHTKISTLFKHNFCHAWMFKWSQTLQTFLRDEPVIVVDILIKSGLPFVQTVRNT